MQSLPVPRPPRGRRPKNPEERLVLESFRYSVESKIKLHNYAKENGLSITEAINRAIDLLLASKS